MAVITFPPAAGAETVAAAVDSFLDSITVTTTRAGYAETLARLVAHSGRQRLVAELSPETYAVVMDQWNSAAAATWNRHLSALTSFTAWAQRQEILATNPAWRLRRRKVTRRADRSIPRTRLETLLTDDRNALRERMLCTHPRRRSEGNRHAGPGAFWVSLKGAPPTPVIALARAAVAASSSLTGAFVLDR